MITNRLRQLASINAKPIQIVYRLLLYELTRFILDVGNWWHAKSAGVVCTVYRLYVSFQV